MFHFDIWDLDNVLFKFRSLKGVKNKVLIWKKKNPAYNFFVSLLSYMGCLIFYWLFPLDLKNFTVCLSRIIAMYYMFPRNLNWFSTDSLVFLGWYLISYRNFFFFTFTSYFWEEKFQFQKHLALSFNLPISGFDLICKIECLF